MVAWTTCGGIASSRPGSTTSQVRRIGALSHAIGGWQVTGIYQWQSGEPYTVVSGVDNAGWGLGAESNRAIRTGQPLEAPARLPMRPYGSTPRRSPSTRIGSFGETLRGEIFRSQRSRPSIWDLFKRFRFTDDINLQFRAEFFNLFNRVNFDNPGTTPETVGRLRTSRTTTGSLGPFQVAAILASCSSV